MCSGRVEMQANEDLQQIHDGHRNYSSHPNAKCSWLVRAELDETQSPLPIEINVTFFETECGWDHLYIYDGTSSLKSTLLASLCGISNNPPLLYATSGHAFLHFYSDMAYNMSGFDLTIRSIAKIPEPLNPLPALVENTGFGLLTLDRSLLPETMTPRALPSSVRVGAKVFIWGGYQFPDYNSEPDNATWLIDLDGAIEPKKLDYSSPPIRYGAPTTIFRKTHALIYGGVKFPDYHLFNDLWVLDTSQNIGWTQVKATSYSEDQSSEKLFTMAGHSMVTVTFQNGTELILCFGGYVDDAGFVSLTVEFVPHEEKIDQFLFRYPETLGFRVPGSYGHVSVVDPENPSHVYLYGGFQNNIVRNELVVYDATTRIFTQLRTAENAARRWLHAGGIVGRHLIFLSGNSHTDTSHSSGTLCYSDEILLYSIECGKWTTIQSSEKWFPRYGSASISLDDKVMLIGGYDGELKNEIITFEPSDFPNECSVVTRTSDDSCERVEHPFAAPTYCSSCVFKNSHRDESCHYCADSSGTERDTCAATPEKGYRNTNTCYSDVQDCPDFKQWTCSLSHKRCTSCITSGCSYVVKRYFNAIFFSPSFK
jgi:attractin